jgi:hypothetical protein
MEVNMKLFVFWGDVYTPEEWEKVRIGGEEPYIIDTTWSFEKIVKVLESNGDFKAILQVAEMFL